jgi:glycosyltransferase involved in cell wall biosynthesis
VIIPTYNRAHCISDAIDSVLAQSFRDFELIVVDDGSTDETPDIVGAYGDRIKLIRQKNGGASAARNAGIRVARGEWIAFLDSDDIWEPDKLKIQTDDLCSNPNAVAHMVDTVICDVRPPPYPSLFELRGLREEFRQKPFRQRPLCDVLKAQFFTSCWMLQRSTIEAAGCFDPTLKIFEDLDLLTRVALEGPFIVNSYIGVMLRRQSEESCALSELYQESRLQSFQNLMHTYKRLKLDSRLTNVERQRVRRSLSGVRCEVAVLYMQQQQWRAAIITFFRSVVDDPGLRSFARAVLTATGIKAIIAKLLPWRQKQESLRRSEMNGSSLDKEINSSDYQDL